MYISVSNPTEFVKVKDQECPAIITTDVYIFSAVSILLFFICMCDGVGVGGGNGCGRISDQYSKFICIICHQ